MRFLMFGAAFALLALAPAAAMAEAGAHDREDVLKRIYEELVKPPGNRSLFPERQPMGIEQRGEPRGNYGTISAGFYFERGVEYGFAYIESKSLMLVGLPSHSACRGGTLTLAVGYPRGSALGASCLSLLYLLSYPGTVHFYPMRSMQEDLDKHLAHVAPFFRLKSLKSEAAVGKTTAEVQKR